MHETRNILNNIELVHGKVAILIFSPSLLYTLSPKPQTDKPSGQCRRVSPLKPCIEPKQLETAWVVL